MAMPNINVPEITTTDKGLEACIRLPELEEGEHYTIEFLKEVLQHNRIRYGVDETQLHRIIEGELYGEDVLVAKGELPVDGIDGYYEYMFAEDGRKQPQIRPDGSVDYWSMYSIEAVSKGQTIAVYHPPVQGKQGMSVFGEPIPPKAGREQPPIRGMGFERLQDNVTYVASLDGKIEMQDGKIRISSIYEVSGDVNMTNGNIDFAGDVVIHGSVETGISIKASGSITVDGVVEACDIEAGKDIILRKGMIGGNKAHVKTKGNLFAKFIEYTTIHTGGNIEADVLLDCKVFCGGDITLQGKRASIIGGNVHAVRGIKATNIGNDAETRTDIIVGTGLEEETKLAQLQKKVEAAKEETEKLETALKRFEALEAEHGISYREDPRRLALLRARIQKTAMLAGDEAEIKKLEKMIFSGKNATVSVGREVFAGTVIFIREERLTLQNNARCVEFYYHDGKIRTRAAD